MTRRKVAPPLAPTEREWRTVFDIRCRSKRGSVPSQEELALCMRARDADRDRYNRMDDEIFDATAPFGSITKRRKEE